LRYPKGDITLRSTLSPGENGYAVLLPEDLVAKLAEIAQFIIINGDENDSIFGQKISGEIEPRIHHVQPLGMIASFAT
jgi:hypothetical protein